MNVTCRIVSVRGRVVWAAVGALLLPALEALAQATIVYRDIEDPPVFTLSGSVFYHLDFDGDGLPDVRFRGTGSQFDCVPLDNNRILSTPRVPPDLSTYVIPLTLADEISAMPNDPYVWNPSLKVASGRIIGSAFTSCMNTGFGLVCLGLFTCQNAYMGVEFEIDGELHYAWVRVDCSLGGINGGRVTEYAYETRPGAPIKAGAKPVVAPMAAPEVARADYLRLKWPSEVGKAYQVQTKARMDALRWTNLDFVVPATSTETMVDLPVEGTAGFFRVVEAD